MFIHPSVFTVFSKFKYIIYIINAIIFASCMIILSALCGIMWATLFILWIPTLGWSFELIKSFNNFLSNHDIDTDNLALYPFPFSKKSGD